MTVLKFLLMWQPTMQFHCLQPTIQFCVFLLVHFSAIATIDGLSLNDFVVARIQNSNSEDGVWVLRVFLLCIQSWCLLPPMATPHWENCKPMSQLGPASQPPPEHLPSRSPKLLLVIILINFVIFLKLNYSRLSDLNIKEITIDMMLNMAAGQLWV